MSVYVDGLHVWGGDSAPPCFRHKSSCHMYADTLEELHAMAASIGMKRAWFQDHLLSPHYDLVPAKRALAVQKGAIEHDWHQTAAFTEKYRRRLLLKRVKEQVAATGLSGVALQEVYERLDATDIRVLREILTSGAVSKIAQRKEEGE